MLHLLWRGVGWREHGRWRPSLVACDCGDFDLASLMCNEAFAVICRAESNLTAAGIGRYQAPWPSSAHSALI